MKRKFSEMQVEPTASSHFRKFAFSQVRIFRSLNAL
jgi:hypothetical protein